MIYNIMSLEVALWKFYSIDYMLRYEEQSVPTGVRIIAFFSLMAGFWFISQSLSIFTSASLDSVIMMADGIVDLAIGVGFTLGASWAWTLRVVVSIVLLIEGTLTLLFLISDNTFGLSEYSEYLAFSIGALIINPLILYYLYRPHVKTYFGKVTPQKYLQ
jgi:hypothetical protein